MIYVKYNSFQKATFLNSTNRVTGNLYAQVDQLKGYLSLKETNDSLARENARLRNQLKSSFYTDTITKRKVNDTIYKQQYQYIEAKVVKNSVNQRSNYITINMGSNAGIVKGMGVICSSGIVGKVLYVDTHFSIVQSLLHKDSQFSVMLANNKEIGSIGWGDDLDPHKGLLYNISNSAQPKLGESVVTSDLSLFPAGILIGKISNLHSKSAKGGFLSMDVDLSVNFSKLEYVYVVTNKFAQEQTGLEAREK